MWLEKTLRVAFELRDTVSAAEIISLTIMIDGSRCGRRIDGHVTDGINCGVHRFHGRTASVEESSIQNRTGNSRASSVINFISKEPEDKPITSFIFNQTTALGTDSSVFNSRKFERFGYTVELLMVESKPDFTQPLVRRFVCNRQALKAKFSTILRNCTQFCD